MNIKKIVLWIINLFDNYKSKKIYSLLSKEIKIKPVIFDVGAHYGETIKLANSFFFEPHVYSFEISKKNFQTLKKKIKINNYKKSECFNFGLSDIDGKQEFYQSIESSSTTISKINKKSKYLKKKLFVLGNIKYDNFITKDECNLVKLDTFCDQNNIKKIDLLKIDTEGHEIKVLKGGLNSLKKIRYIFFEHHYDDMIVKGYKFSDISKLLKKNNFKQIYKSKMFFRKTFEYIYVNENTP